MSTTSGRLALAARGAGRLRVASEARSPQLMRVVVWVDQRTVGEDDGKEDEQDPGDERRSLAVSHAGASIVRRVAASKESFQPE